jgi:hypothetical protein
MNLSLLILALLAAVTHSCPPPFNSFLYYDNKTLLHDAITQYTSSPELGWLHAVDSPSPIHPWPTNSHGITLIPFCCTNYATKDKIGDIFIKAWLSWYRVLGNPGRGAEHRLGGFQELRDIAGGSKFCFLDHKRKNWDPTVSGDVLVVDVNEGHMGSVATMGYRPKEW